MKCDRGSIALYDLARPLLFAFPPSEAHELAMETLGALEHVRVLRNVVAKKLSFANDTLRVECMGLTFPNPLGLAGGFDKNARRPRALAALGFGFIELGTVTALAQEANPRPNLFRLPFDRALVNRLGFPNEGAAVVAERSRRTIGARGERHEMNVPVAFSIGKSRLVDIDPLGPLIADYLTSFDAVRPVSDFVVVNVSSPNTKNLRAIQSGVLARELLGALVSRRAAANDDVPLLVKVAPDLEDDELDALFEVVRDVGFDGVIATNTTIKRVGLATDDVVVRDVGAGGLSGPPLFTRARAVVARARARLGASKTIIGVGGISGAPEARAMLDAGADLLQVYTGFVYGGPAFVRRTLEGLVRAHALTSSVNPSGD